MDLIVEIIILVNSVAGIVKGVGVPDYESPWLVMRSNNPGKARVDVDHELGEVPVLVDVQVRSIDNPNMDFIFPGIGGCPRDDDNPEAYGGVTYLYNDKQIIASAPISNNQDIGTRKALYTGDGIYYTGVNLQGSDNVLIRFRAWRQSSIPPDFHKTNIPVRAGSPNVDEVYVEEDHGFGEYPSFVKVRTKLTDGALVGWMSDAVGASIVAYPPGKFYTNRYVVHGFNDHTVRVWISGHANGVIYAGQDGYKIDTTATTGLLEIMAWKQQTLPPWSSHSSQIGPGVSKDVLEQPFENNGASADDLFVAVWAESMTGPNAGYRFPGGGALAYDDSVTDSTCSYGGLVYGYTASTLRFWRPTTASNGGLICVASCFGKGVNKQLATNAKIVAYSWITSDTERLSNYVYTINANG